MTMRFPKYPKMSCPKLVFLSGLALLALAACATVSPSAGGAATLNVPGTTDAPATARPTAVAATSTPAPTETSTPAPEVWGVVGDGGTLYWDTPGDVDNIEHQASRPEDRLPSGQQVAVVGRSAGGKWLHVEWATDGWIPLSAVARYISGWNGPALDTSAALAAVPVSTDVYPTMDATQQGDATMAVVNATLEAQGVPVYNAESTSWAMLNPSWTPTPVPFPVITATPGPNCYADPNIGGGVLCKDQNGQAEPWVGSLMPFFASQDYLDKAVHGAYAHYLDLVMGRNGPPTSDISEMLKSYMLPLAAHGQPGAPEMLDICTYGDVAGYLSRLQSSNEYLRIKPAGKLVWGKSPSSYGADYYLSLNDNEFRQPGQFNGPVVYELVDIATGRVVKSASSGRPYSFDVVMKYSVQSNTWLISYDDFCGNISDDAGAWQW